MTKTTHTPGIKSLISAPWASPPDHSYYCDPRYVDKEQHGLEHIESGASDDDGIEQVAILGYN